MVFGLKLVAGALDLAEDFVFLLFFFAEEGHEKRISTRW
jgi:hypothetical protein